MPTGDLAGVAVVAVVLFVLGLVVTRQDLLFDGTTALTYALAATGLGVALGLGGEYLLGQAFIFAVGSYTAAIMTTSHGFSFWAGVAAGTAAAVGVGLVLSIIGLRVSRFYFALIGFFLVYLTPDIAQIFASATGGTTGMSVVTVPVFLGGPLSPQGVFYLAAAILVVCLYITRNLRASPLGVLLRKMRDNPVAAATDGIALWRVRLILYLFASLLAGLGGALYGFLNGFLAPQDFSLTLTVLLFAAVIVGGKTALIGPTLGVVVLYVLPNDVLQVPGYSDLIYGAIVLIAVIAFPQGLTQGLSQLWRWTRRKLGPARYATSSGSASPQPTATVAASSRAVAPASDLVVAANGDLERYLTDLRDRPEADDPTLVATGVRKHFGGVAAIDLDDDQQVTVRPGQIHLLLGPNGSGKSTLLNVMTGLIRPDAGTIRLGSRSITRTRPWTRARLGVARSFQGPALPPEITPVDLIAGRFEQLRDLSYIHWLTGSPWAIRTRRGSLAKAEQLLAAAGLGRAAHEPCHGLTSGQRRILDVLNALVSPARLVVLDEPAAGLGETERDQLATTLQHLAGQGVGFLVVEHDLTLAMRIAAEVTVLSSGRIVAQGTPAEIHADPAVRRVLMGEVEWTESSLVR